MVTKKDHLALISLINVAGVVLGARFLDDVGLRVLFSILLIATLAVAAKSVNQNTSAAPATPTPGAR